MILKTENLSFSYPGRQVLRGLSFQISQGECTAVLGTNGAGKSTLLKCLDRVLKPQRGTIYVDDEDIKKIPSNHLAQKLSYVAQNQQQVRSTVFDSVLLGRVPYIQWDAGRKDLEIVEDVLHRFGLSDYAMRYTNELSGGELQKVVIARALAQQPEILLLDEPTSNLDIKNQLEVIAIIQEIAKARRITVVVTMHDLNLALRFAGKFLLLLNGKIYAAGGREIITEETIRNVYGVDVAIHHPDGKPVIVPL